MNNKKKTSVSPQFIDETSLAGEGGVKEVGGSQRCVNFNSSYLVQFKDNL